MSDEPINIGDQIEYYPPNLVAGDKFNRRYATVLSVCPRGRSKLVLSTGDYLPKATKVKRAKVMAKVNQDYTLIDNPSGSWRPIYHFKLEEKGTSTAAHAIVMETARFEEIYKKNMDNLKQKAEKDGFAPMDAVVNMKRRRSKN